VLQFHFNIPFFFLNADPGMVLTHIKRDLFHSVLNRWQLENCGSKKEYSCRVCASWY